MGTCVTPANKAAFAGGYDAGGNPVSLKPKGRAILYSSSGSPIAWADGSEDEPLLLPRMQKSTSPAQTILVMDGTGKMYRLQPGSTVDKQWLVTQAGAVRFENIINERLTRFPAASLDAPTCDWTVSVFTQCEGGSVAKIGRISLADFAEKIKPLLIEEEEEVETGTCLTSISGFNGASPVNLDAAANKMIVACAGEGSASPCWKVVDAGHMFFPMAPKSIWSRPGLGGAANLAQTIVLPDFPQKICPSRDIYAWFYAELGTNAASRAIILSLNGVKVLNVQGDSQASNNMVPIKISDAGTVDLLIQDLGGGSLYGWGGGVTLFGYFR